ncbi:MAG: ribonuclease J [Tenericutes bacterium]|nr:ribonuclease J [Mycoplasmatota bacterium]
MSKINITGLGGLNENGKNLYVVSVDGKILVFDCGMKYAPDKMYGVDYVIPDFKYLVENKKDIVGVFITHPHRENMGALTDLLKVIPNVNVYASNYTCDIIKYECAEEKVEIKNLNVINAHKKIDFKDFSVFPFSVTHSSPETLGYAINTSDGAVIYMADFVIDPTMSGHYDMDLGKLAYIGKQGVLCLMCESVFSEKKGHTSPKHKLETFFKSLVETNKNRIIFTVLPLHIYTIQEIFNALKGKNRKLVIMGKELHSIVSISIKNGYLDVDESMLGNLTDLKSPDTVILISNDRETPYSNINRIIAGHDKFITLEKTDTICFAEPSYDAYEKTIVKIMNELAIKGVNIAQIPKDRSVRHHASSEDIMLLVKLFNPKYYMPIKGEYRYQVENANLANKVGIPSDNILLKLNGDIVTFEKGKLVDNFERIFVDDILIDGKSSEDVGELVLKDRELLSRNGLVIVSSTLSKKDKSILIGPEIMTRGFIYDKENTEIIDEIKRISTEIIKDNTHSSKYADYVKIRNDIREQIGSYLYKATACKPVILTIIQEIER